MRYFFLLLFIFPFLEIYTFIVIGGYFGPINTLLLTLLTAIFGIYLLRNQGFSSILNIRSNADSFEPTADNILKKLFSPIGGFFLLIPGFLSDSLGILILTPITRIFILGIIFNLLTPSKVKSRNHKKEGDWIEGEYEKDK
tara:strand:- start:214 stop:636 length:423 start_codon:yes stop_codon:yes gene_type:complete